MIFTKIEKDIIRKKISNSSAKELFLFHNPSKRSLMFLFVTSGIESVNFLCISWISDASLLNKVNKSTSARDITSCCFSLASLDLKAQFAD